MLYHEFNLCDDEHVWIYIICLMFDCRMAAILSGVGGASCQLFMVTHDELKERELIIQDYPIKDISQMRFNCFENLRVVMNHSICFLK